MQETDNATSGTIIDHFEDHGYMRFRIPDRRVDTATGARRDLERNVSSTARRRQWIRASVRRRIITNHVYSTHCPTVWADTSEWLEVWVAARNGMQNNTKAAHRIAMGGYFNIGAKMVRKSADDPRCMRLAEHIIRHGVELQTAGTTTMRW